MSENLGSPNLMLKVRALKKQCKGMSQRSSKPCSNTSASTGIRALDKSDCSNRNWRKIERGPSSETMISFKDRSLSFHNTSESGECSFRLDSQAALSARPSMTPKHTELEGARRELYEQTRAHAAQLSSLDRHYESIIAPLHSELTGLIAKNSELENQVEFLTKLGLE